MEWTFVPLCYCAITKGGHMKKYSVLFISKNVHTFDVIAETEEEAINIAKSRIDDGDEGDYNEESLEEMEFYEISEISDENTTFHDVDDDNDCCDPKKGEEMIRFRSPLFLKKRFKEHCLKENVSMQMVLYKLLGEYMAKTSNS
jgi:hypothetical protein